MKYNKDKRKSLKNFSDSLDIEKSKLHRKFFCRFLDKGV